MAAVLSAPPAYRVRLPAQLPLPARFRSAAWLAEPPVTAPDGVFLLVGHGRTKDPPGLYSSFDSSQALLSRPASQPACGKMNYQIPAPHLACTLAGSCCTDTLYTLWLCHLFRAPFPFRLLLLLNLAAAPSLKQRTRSQTRSSCKAAHALAISCQSCTSHLVCLPLLPVTYVFPPCCTSKGPCASMPHPQTCCCPAGPCLMPPACTHTVACRHSRVQQAWPAHLMQPVHHTRRATLLLIHTLSPCYGCPPPQHSCDLPPLVLRGRPWPPHI